MKLFDTIALEEIQIAETENNEAGLETTESMDDIRQDCEQLDEHFEGAFDYFNVQDCLGENPSPAATAIALIAVESIQRKLSFPISSIATENDDAKEDKVGFFTRVWTAIKNFFTRIWNWLTGLFKKQTDKNKELERIQKQDAVKLKNLLSSIPVQNDPVVKKLIIEAFADNSSSLFSKLKPFDYMHKGIKLDDIEKLADVLLKNIHEVSKIISSVQKTTTVLTQTFNSFEYDNHDDGGTVATKLQILTAQLAEAMTNSDINHCIAGMHNDSEQSKLAVKYFTQNPVPHAELTTLRVLSGYTQERCLSYLQHEFSTGAKLYFAHHDVTSVDADSDSKKSYFDSSLAEVNTLQKLLHLNTKLDSVRHELYKFETSFLVTANVLIESEGKVKDIIDSIDRHPNFPAVGDTAKHAVLSNLRSYQKFITSHALTGYDCTNYTASSLKHIFDLSGYIQHVHQKANHTPVGE
jgi:hypothetical protein